MICLKEKLERLFLNLDEWRLQNATSTEVSSSDQLAIISLKISCALLDDYSLGKIIGKHLSLIIDEQTSFGCSAHDELLKSFMLVEENLEAHLRGFSALMDLILEEGKIRYDGIAVLHQITDVDAVLSQQFSSLVTTLETYCELEEAFSLDMPKAAALIFLMILTELHARLSGSEKKQSNAVIARWLRCRSKNMVLLYDEAMRISNLSSMLTAMTKEKKELLVVRLCFMVASGETIKAKDVTLLDRLLQKMGMFGLKPFVDAGFLVTKKCFRN